MDGTGGIPPGNRRRDSGPWTVPDGTRAESTVISVVLVVTITVVLASVVGGIVFGLGDADDPAPQASVTFAVDTDDDVVRLEHEAGETLYSDRTRIVWEIDDSTYRSQPPDTGTELSSSERTDFHFDGSTDATGTWTNYPSPGTHDIQDSDVITVTLYDTESGQRVYTESFTVREVAEDL